MFNPMVNNGGGIPVSSVIENKKTFVFGSGENKNNNCYTLDKFYKYIESLILNDTQHCLNKNIKNIINKIKDERHIITNIPAKYLQRYHYERPVEIYKEYVKNNKIFNHSRCKHDKINNNSMILETLDYLKNIIIDNNCVPQEHKPEKKESECIFGYCSKKNKTTDNSVGVDFEKMNTPEPVKQTGTQGFSVPLTPFGAKAPKAQKDSLNPFEHCVFSAFSTPQGSSNPSVPQVPQEPQEPQEPLEPLAPVGFTGFKFPEPPAKTQGSCEQQYGILNLDSIASLKLNFNLDHAVRAIVAYRVSESLDSLQRAIQYLNNELENSKTK